MTDQSRPVSRVSVVEALTQIRALCDEHITDAHPGRLIGQVRAILDAVSVDAAPPQGIDRDALTELLHDMVDAVDEIDEEWSQAKFEDFRDRVLALESPVEFPGYPVESWERVAARYSERALAAESKLGHIRRLVDQADEIAAENDPPRIYGAVATPTLRRLLEASS